ncbi:MAG: glycine oxidase ThiO [Gemmatimonadota bacterium]|jgi:glycine oxidase
MVYRIDIEAAVVGGGLIGCLVARALAAQGLGVVLIERDPQLGRRASTAAAGMLSPQMEAAEGLLAESSTRAEAMLAFCLAGRDWYPGLVESLTRETGFEIEYRAHGTLVVATDPTRAEALATAAATHAARGLTAEFVDGDRARQLEPALAAGTEGGLLLPDDHQVDSVALVGAAAGAVAADPRVRLELNCRGVGVETAAGRVIGVQLERADGAADYQTASLVVIAGGAWSENIAGLPRRLGVVPVKGQMVAVDGRAAGLTHTVGGPGAYCVPRSDGRVLIGATVEQAGFDITVDEAAIAGLVAAAADYVPALGRSDRLSTWAGIRPGTSDELPIVGPDPDVEGLVYATGHYRNGILLAPITAQAVAALARGSSPPVDLTPFSPARLGDPQNPARGS